MQLFSRDAGLNFMIDDRQASQDVARKHQENTKRGGMEYSSSFKFLVD